MLKKKYDVDLGLNFLFSDSRIFLTFFSFPFPKGCVVLKYRFLPIWSLIARTGKKRYLSTTQPLGKVKEENI